jgi:hypothetical protein
MLKMRLTDKAGQPVFILGLSDKNLQKLRAGEPILVNLTALGGSDQVLLYAGQTEKSMIQDLQNAGLLPATAAPDTPSA